MSCAALRVGLASTGKRHSVSGVSVGYADDSICVGYTGNFSNT